MRRLEITQSLIHTIVDQDVDPDAPVDDGLGELADGGHGHEVQGKELDASSRQTFRPGQVKSRWENTL